MNSSKANRRYRGSCQNGLTIVELMIALTLGLFVVLTATGLLVTAKTSYIMQAEATRLDDTGRFANGQISRALRQSGYRNRDPDEGPVLPDGAIGTNVMGLDASGLQSDAEALTPVPSSAVNGSDVLAVRFFGVGGGVGDGSMLNCAGFSVGVSALSADGSDQRGWSIFYVAKDATGEPELRCKYQGKSGWTSDAIARGVESFQVLYGVDLDSDGLPDRFVNARAIDAMAGTGAPVKQGATSGVAGLPASSGWTNVVEVRIAMLIRGAQGSAHPSAPSRFELFGAAYGSDEADNDPGAVIVESNLPASAKNRLRKVFRFSVQLRPATGGVTS
ncbi:MAG: PilW family protein [Herminiimonas sp.]|nr:PilW family protein [Herminiimonas sp.]